MTGLRFTLLGFPIAVQPFFLLTAWLIGPRHDMQSSIVWIGCVFVGVLAHEFGHAAMARHFGFEPIIILHGFGGLTSWRSGRDIGHGKQILLSAAGPAVGITLGILALVAGRAAAFPANGLAKLAVDYAVWVNLGWGVLNLLPVLPLDGGHIATAAAEAVFGKKGRTVALILSLVLTGILALWMMWLGQIWMTILAVILSISNFQALGLFNRKSAPTSQQDPSASDAERAYVMAQSMAAAGEDREALKWLETAVYAGFADGRRIDQDESWEALRKQARFQSLRRSMQDSR